jgi:hypothetical protein
MSAVPLRGAVLPLGFQQRRLVIGHAALHLYEAREWSEALVVVERGVLELEWSGGARLCFEPGDTLCLSGLGLRGLRGASVEPTVLVVLSRPGSAAGARNLLQ